MSIKSLNAVRVHERSLRVRYQQSVVWRICTKATFWAWSEKQKELQMVEVRYDEQELA